jgi:hypothetical protein
MTEGSEVVLEIMVAVRPDRVKRLRAFRVRRRSQQQRPIWVVVAGRTVS